MAKAIDYEPLLENIQERNWIHASAASLSIAIRSLTMQNEGLELMRVALENCAKQP